MVSNEVSEASAAVRPVPSIFLFNVGKASPPVIDRSPHSEPGTMDLGVSKWRTWEKPDSSLKFQILKKK